MPGSIVILSDLHLGRPRHSASSAEAVRPLWRGAAHLILNGDVAEVHHPKHWAAAARQVVHLFDLCEADGVELTLLSGNHDPFLSDFRHLRLAEGEVFVTHGDAMHPAIAPWSPAGARMREAHAIALASIGSDDRDALHARLEASQHAGYAEWADADQVLREESSHSSVRGMLIRPWALLKVLLYWRAFPELALRFAVEHAPEARFIVLGHTHRPGVWSRGGRVILNTGSFGFPGSPRAVVIDGGELRFHRVIRGDDAHELDPSPLRTYELRAPIAGETTGRSGG